MLGYICIGTLAAFGLLCAVWILCGLFTDNPRGRLLYLGEDVLLFARRYLWLREMGLIRCPLAVAEAEEDLLQWLEAQGIEIYDREAVLSRFGIGAEEH